MKQENITFKQFSNFYSFRENNNFLFKFPLLEGISDSVSFYKKGNKIKIKKQNRGKFTDYCGGKVTEECIRKGKNSPDPKIRRRATFAANARKWKHLNGGPIILHNNRNADFSYLFKNKK